MKNVFFLICLFCNFGATIMKAQNVCFSSPFTVTNSVIDNLGNQTHTVDVQIQNTSSITVSYLITGHNGQVLQTSPGTILPGQTVDNTFDLFLGSAETQGIVYIQILTSGFNNGNCSNLQSFSLPPIPVCLEIISGHEIDCIVDNDGIGIEGDIHVYQMQVLNNDLTAIEFSLTANQDLSVDFHPAEFILPGQTKTVTYHIRSNSGTSASGEILFVFENQNYTSGCEGPVFLSFQPCQVSACLEFGAIDYDGCGSNPDGTVSHTFNANVINASNLPLQYSILPLTSGTILGATSRTIAANTTEFVSFDYITNVTNTQFNFYIETETVSVVNGCEEVIQLTLPNCSTQASSGSLRLFAFFDTNNNGEPEATESGIPSIEFRVTKMGSGETKTVMTNSVGQVLVFDLEPGLYLINQQVDFPWKVTNPAGGALNNVQVLAGKTTTLDFANYHPNANIAPITIHSLDAVCLAEQSSGQNVYKIFGQMSTSFTESSTLSVVNQQNQNASNLAIGQVPALGSYIPFSFDFVTNQDSLALVFSLSTSITSARDTMSIKLPACCSATEVTDTIYSCEQLAIEYGSDLTTNLQSRMGRITVTNFAPCTKSIGFQWLPTTIGIVSDIEIDGVLIPYSHGANINIPAGTKKIQFYINATPNGSTCKMFSYGCKDTCNTTFNIGLNQVGLGFPVYEIVQETPDFSNIYGATMKLTRTTNLPNVTAKYVSFGLGSNTANAIILGATGADYFDFENRDQLLFVDKMSSNKDQIHFVLTDQKNNQNLEFNFFYSATQKAIPIVYNIYDKNGRMIGRGSYTLDGDKVISKVEDSESGEDEIQMFPNPATDIINVHVKSTINPSGISYEIKDMQGIKVRQGILFAQQEKIDISVLSTGQYILYTTDNNGMSTQIKFLKVK